MRTAPKAAAQTASAETIAAEIFRLAGLPIAELHRRLKSGTILVREFEGTRHTVTIVPDGYVWQEKTYASLTAIARIITGTNWNGPRFFGLRVGVGRKDQSSEAAA